MPHTSNLIQSGEALYVVTEDGGQATLTLPSTVTLTDERKPRFEVNKVHAVVVNSVDQPIIVDDNGIVLFLSPIAPSVAPTTAVGAAGALTGTYQVKYTFAIRDLDENVVAESGFSPTSTVVLTADKLTVSALALLTGLTPANYNARYEVVRRVYRTTAGTSTFFLWYTVEDNTTTTFSDDATDASLAAFAADALGTVPYLSHVASFRDRLFGINDSEDREKLLYSEVGLRWAWPTDNYFRAPQVKGDSQSGVTALMPRREALGLAKSNMLMQLTGTSDDDFRIVVLSTTIGAINQESVCTFRDEVYFLGYDGVYRWTDSGIDNLSDGRVRSWFTTDEYFNRSIFNESFAVVDPIEKSYKLYLASADSDEIDCWVEYDIETNTWWGPHISAAYEFTSAFQLSSHTPLIGAGTSDGFITVDTDTRSDDTDTAIAVEAIMTPIVNDPPVTSYWGKLSIEVEPDTGTLSIYPTVGELDDAEGTVIEHDLSDPHTALERLGYGRYVTLRLTHETVDQTVQILGMEIDPVNRVGKRE